MGIAAHLRPAVHTNFIHICRKQKTTKEKKLSKKSIIDSEEQVLKINAKGSEHLNDILEARAIGKEHLDDYLNERFFEEKISF